MTLGRSAGAKTCDDCGDEYAGPAYRTFDPRECPTAGAAHPGCTGNLCPRCAGDLEPDRPGDARRPAPPRGRLSQRSDAYEGRFVARDQRRALS